MSAPHRRIPSLRELGTPLLLLLLVAALLRLPTVGVQSFWLDEAYTADLMRLGPGDLWAAIRDGESTPPLYYLLARLWAVVFGNGEVGLRLLSALLGIATVPIVAALGARIGGRRTALIASALVACNPLVVWYAQEARSYALLIPLAALSVLMLQRALERRVPERMAAWGVVAALAMATHYFAIYLVAVEVLWLLWATRPRLSGAVLAGLAPPVLAGAALAPLALQQRGNDSASFIRETALSTRIVQIPKQWLVGFDAPAESALAIAAGLLALVGVAGLAVALRRPGRGEAYGVLAVAAGGVLLPLLLALLGEDHLLTRNVIGALPLALCLVGLGLAELTRLGGRIRDLALAATLVLFVGWALLDVEVARNPDLQRDDWRGAAEALGSIQAPRAIVVSPGSGRIPVAHYLEGAEVMPIHGARVREIDLLALAEREPGKTPRPPRPEVVAPPAPGFALVGRHHADTFTVLRFRAPQPVAVTARQLAPSALGGGEATVLVQTR